jgi:hypothetical protein
MSQKVAVQEVHVKEFNKSKDVFEKLLKSIMEDDLVKIKANITSFGKELNIKYK